MSVLSRFFELGYAHALKPLLFRCDPERVHDGLTVMGSVLASTTLTQRITRSLFRFDHPSLVSTVAGLMFDNPVGLAAGFDKNAKLWDIMPDVGFGFVELGSITGQKCAGNPRPRVWRLPEHGALQVYYGLQNNGAKAIRHELCDVQPRCSIGISVAKTNSSETVQTTEAIKDYCTVTETFRNIAGYFTLNISCPNAFGGQAFTDPKLLEALLVAVDAQNLTQPIFIKLSPDLSEVELDGLLEVMDRHRVAGIVCTNLVKDASRTSLLPSAIPGRGGFSGKLVQKLSDAQLLYVARRTKGRYVLIGVGGIFTAEDAYRKIRSGASLVQLITGMVFRGPQLIGDINRGLVDLMHRDGFNNIAQAVGADV